MASKDIIFCGGLVCDITAFVPRFPKPGETQTVTRSVRGFGGGSANSAYLVKQMGGETALVGKIGNDEFGKEFKTFLGETGINYDHVTASPSEQTSVAILMVNDEGENSIIHMRNAMDRFTIEDALAAADDLLIKDSGQVLVCTYECPRKPLLEILKRAKQYNITTLLNAAPWTGEAWEELYPYVDIMTVNETEAELTTTLPVTSLSEAESAARLLVDKGCRIVIVTMGKNGALAVSGDGRVVRVHSPQVKAVDPTGAGDAFVGSLSFYLRYYPELPMPEKLSRACAVASIVVQKEGTLASYPSAENIPEHLLRHGPGDGERLCEELDRTLKL